VADDLKGGSSMLYMFQLYSEPGTESPSDVIDQHLAFCREARERNAYVTSEALGNDPASAKIVRVRQAKILATDGPFAEAKEFVGGFYILDCKDLNEARQYAAKIPDAKYGSVEIRPIVAVPDWPYGDDRRRHPMG
jgi:hypothetical protein